MYEPTNAELARSLSRIEVKIDKVSDDHESRLRKVEKAVYMSLGLAGAGVASGIGTFITSILSGGR